MSEPRPRDGIYDFQADNSGRTKTKLDSGPLKTWIVLTNIEDHECVCVSFCVCVGDRGAACVRTPKTQTYAD